MMRSILVRSTVAALLAASLAAAQDRPETRMFVADRGNLSSGSDGGIFEFTITGGFQSQLPAFGGGAIRDIAVADDGDVYVARGSAVNHFDAATGYASGQTFALGSMAQSVAVHPATGNVWCAFGVSAATAMIVEMTPTGTTVNTITDSLLVHPRSLGFDFSGDDLYVANSTGGNVLHIDATPAGTPTVSVFAADTDLGTGLLPTHVYPSRVQDDFVTVVGDYGGDTNILTVTGVPGAVAVTTLVAYGSLTDLLAPAGGDSDSSGNLYVAGRDRNMGIPGIYVMREDSGNRPIPVITATQLVSPMAVAFRRTTLDVTITSPDGVNADGTPLVLSGSPQPTMLGIDILAPEFPNAGYAIFFSTFSPPLLQLACDDRPLGAGIDLAANGDPRFLPLDNTDAVTIGESLNIVQSGGIGVLSTPQVCTGQDGSVARFIGGLDALGQANAEMNFPGLVCPPFPDITYGFTVVILDGITAPIGIGAMSTFPSCLILRSGP